MSIRRAALAACMLVALAGGAVLCGQFRTGLPPAFAAGRLAGTEDFLRPDAVPFPADNPYSEAKAELGRRLFFDPRLSGGNTMACATCHRPELGFEDGRRLAFGEAGQPVPRHVPHLWNLAWGQLFFWDGRAESLEEQALMPVGSTQEMGQDPATLAEELAAVPEYRTAFAAAFPENPEVSLVNLAKAIATFERTLVSPETPFDRWMAGDETAIGEDARRGFALFTGKAGCVGCHSGWAFTDHAFHDIGLPGKDRGRGAVLDLADLDHAFKTPGLREVGGRAPYMHDGSLDSLEAVLDHYAGGIIMRPTLSPDLTPLALTGDERGDLLAFLATLDSDRPASPRPDAPVVASLPPVDGPPVMLAEVIQRNKAFDRAAVVLRAGGLLRVQNEDQRVHNLRIFDDKLDYNSGIQKPGEVAEIRFALPGRYRIFCGIHPKMELTVTVQ